MNERRPDPDALLEKARREAERSREGKLKIFFGAAPGVGRPMHLEAAGRSAPRAWRSWSSYRDPRP